MNHGNVHVLMMETSPASGLETMVPEFKAPGNYKDPAKIQIFLEEKRKEWLNGPHDSFHDSTVACVTLRSLHLKEPKQVTFSGEETEIFTGVCDWLNENPGEVITGWRLCSRTIPYLVKRAFFGRLEPYKMQELMMFARDPQRQIDLHQVLKAGYAFDTVDEEHVGRMLLGDRYIPDWYKTQEGVLELARLIVLKAGVENLV